MAMELVLLLLLNNKSVIRYSVLVHYIIYNTYIINDRRGTAISISDVCNDILYTMKEMNSFVILHMHRYLLSSCTL